MAKSAMRFNFLDIETNIGVKDFTQLVDNSVDGEPCRRMYLQFACNVTAMGNDSMNGEVEFVGDGFVGHALHNAGDDFLFAL